MKLAPLGRSREFKLIAESDYDKLISFFGVDPLLLYLIAIHSIMIKTFRHKGLERFFREGSKAGIQPQHAKRPRLQLGRLDAAKSAVDMNLPGWKWHPLTHDLKGHWSVWVSGNWRLTFTFEGSDAILIDYQDYH